MGGILGGSSRANNPRPPASALRFQTAVNGTPIPILHGQNRLAGNCTWYDGFLATPSSSGGGKGLDGGASGTTTYTYSVDVTFGICEGPIDQVLMLWAGKKPRGLEKKNFTVFSGAQGQSPWGFLTGNYAEVAIGYSSLAYAGANPLQLGSSPDLPNITWEAKGAIANAVIETYTIGVPYTFTPTYWSLASSVTELVIIPPGSPPTVKAQNYKAKTAIPVVLGFITGTLPGTGSQGALYTATGLPLTRVSSSPAAGQYSVSSAGLYTFNAADAGKQVQIIDLAVSPGVRYAYLPTANTHGTTLVDGISAMTGIQAGQLVTGPGFQPGTVVQSVGADSVILSLPTTSSLAGAALIFFGAALHQVLGTPATGQFSVSVQAGTYGQYKFAAADAGSSVVIVDIPDANPADSLVDFLSNPRYGAGFPASYFGDHNPTTGQPFDTLRNYASSLGLFISPAIVQAQAANAYLKDFCTGLNGEFVWSSGVLRWVPYGDSDVSGFGYAYTAPSAPVYSLGDDDLLKNEGTASVGVSAFTSDDPIVCVRSRQSDAYNDVKVEYIDRGNSYNPAIVEAQDDAAINAFGLRPQDTKSLHFFCIEAAALMSAHLQLGRQQIRNQYSFTVPWYFILLDPMDIIAITDPALGLDQQWVRVLEITENQQDSTLTITAEEHMAGTATAPIYGSQPKAGAVQNYDVAPPPTNTPVVFAAPPKIADNGALEIWIAASGPSGWGGCDVYVSSDDTTYRNVGRILGPARQGVLVANFPSGTDPDTTNTLSVDLTESLGELTGGTVPDADLGHTLCYVDGELVAFSAVALTAANQYALGTYIRRGLYGTTPGEHAAGSAFARLDQGIFKLAYSADQIGSTLYLKLTAFNLYQGGEQDIATVMPMAFVVPPPPVPAAVNGFSAQQNGGPVAFSWTDSADPQGSLKGYDLLFGPQGGAVASASFLTQAARTTETTTVAVPPGAWTFYIRGHDLAGQVGPAVSVNLTVSNANAAIISQINEPDWLGPSLPSFAMDAVGWFNDGSAPLGNYARSGSAATRINHQNAVVPSLPANWLRRDFDLLTAAPLGWLLEGIRTNALRHNDMAGATPGTPGTQPTTWTLAGAVTGLSRTVVGTGIEYGIRFVDVQWFGTPSANGARTTFFEASQTISAIQNQTWSMSGALRLMGGSLTNINSINPVIQEQNSSGSSLVVDTGPTLVPTGSLLQYSFSAILSNASTAYVRPGFQFSTTIGQPINFTLRIYSPQLEQNGFNSSLIFCSGTPTTRSADIWSIPVSSILNWATDRGSVRIQAVTAPGIEGTDQELIRFDDGSVNNHIRIRRDGLTRHLHCVAVSATLTEADLDLGAVADGTTFAVAFCWGPAGFFASLNGGLVASATGAVPSGITTARIGAGISGSNWFGHLLKAEYYGLDMSPPQTVSATAYPASSVWGRCRSHTGVLVWETDAVADALTNAQLFEQYVPQPVASAAYVGSAGDLGFNSSVRAFFKSSAAAGRGILGQADEVTYLDTWLDGATDPESFIVAGPGNVTARYLRAKIVGGSVTDYVSQFEFFADSPPQTYVVSGLAVPSGGLTVNWATLPASPPLPTAFHVLPSVQVTPSGGVATGGAALGTTKTGATIQLYNGSVSSPVADTCNLLITGA